MPHTHRDRIENAGLLLRSLVLRSLLLSALWRVLIGDAEDGWAIGAVTVAFSVAASLYLLPPQGDRVAIRAIPGFVGFFLLQSVRGGFQVAHLALQARLQLQPVMLNVALRLPQEPARIFLACVLNLLPGTLSAGLDGRMLRVHVLDRRLPAEPEIRLAERRIAQLLKVELQ